MLLRFIYDRKKTMFSLKEPFSQEISCLGQFWKLKDLVKVSILFHTEYVFTAIKLQNNFQEAQTYVS